MRSLATIIIILCSTIAKGQDVNFALTNGSSKKWIGVEKNGASSTNLIFRANHKVEEQPVNSYKNPFSQQWQLLSGNTTRDENITLEIGGLTYTAIFSKTSHGSDFMTLTYYKNDRAVTMAYYSE